MSPRLFTDSNRFYRLQSAKAEDLGEVSFQVVLEQTDLWIVAERDLHEQLLDYVRELRGQLKAHILLQPEFLASLSPVDVPDGAPPIVRAMAEAAKLCGVGPMAAVAGATAQAVADRFAEASPNILVENGGDLYLRSTRERLVGLLAVPGEGARLGVRLAPGDFPVSLCSSSGLVGPSLSLGMSDIVTVRSRSGAIADAAATTLGNILKSGRDLTALTRKAQELVPAGVTGVFAQCGGRIAAWGDMELVALSA